MHVSLSISLSTMPASCLPDMVLVILLGGKMSSWSRRYAGVAFDQSDLGITLGDVPLMRGGQPLSFDEEMASKYMKLASAVHGTVKIGVSIGKGLGQGSAWGCDLSYDYVKINAEYTT